MSVAGIASAQEHEGGFDRELAAWRLEIRQHALDQLARPSAKPPRSLRIGVLVLLLSLFLVSMLGMRQAMRTAPLLNETAVEVRLLDTDSPEPAMPVPAKPILAPPHPAPTSAHVPTRVVATTPAAAVAAPAETAALPQLFNLDGSIRLPPEPALRMPTAQQLSAELMQRGHNMLHCRQSRFAAGYKRDESMGDEIARKYLVWIGLYNAEYAERKAAQRQADAAAACDG